MKNSKKDLSLKIEGLSKRLTDIAASSDSEWELRNVVRDLEAIYARFEQGYYHDTSFLQRNQYDVPQRTNEFFNYFFGYHEQAKKWAEILRRLPLEAIDSVLDICPGWAPKIEWALAELDFQGDLYLLDKSQEALQRLEKFLKILRPKYTTHFLHHDFFSFSGRAVDLLIANHVIDDLLLDMYCNREGFLLEEIYASEPLLKKVTERIMNQSSHVQERFCQNFAAKIHSLVKEGGYFACMHYPGLAESALDLSEWTKWILEALQGIYQHLIVRGYQNVVEECCHSSPLKSSSRRMLLLQKKSSP